MIARATSSSAPSRLIGKTTLIIASALAILFVLSGIAHADLDRYSTGDGHEGNVTVATSSVLNYSAPINASVSAGASSLTTGAGQTGAVGTATTTGSAAQTQFEANRLALVIQSTNYSGTATSGSQADIDLSSSAVGRWELARIQSVTGSIAGGMNITFTSPLSNSYASTGAQVVAVPEFTTVQINSARGWTANPWNGTSGGITAFLANGAVNMAASSSTISADGSGFRGGVAYNTGGSGCTQLDGTGGGGKGEGIVSGVYPGTSATYASRGNVANAGGGGDCENAGGGGGGNGGVGGKGGYSYDGNRDVGGLGGAKLNYSAFDHAVFGGGGGAGDANNNVAGPGGNGGGFVFVRAANLTGSGTISAAGAAGGNSANVGSSDGAGGGGAGGVVYARFTGAAACTLVSAKGGAGGNEQSTAGVHGPGGGGAGGRLVLQSSGGTCPTNISNGVAGTTTSGNSNRGSGPTSATDATSSGATESVSGGGGMSTPTAALSTPADGAYVNSATPTITGTSSMSLGTIRVTIDGAYVGATTTLVNGNWSFTPSSALTAGSHTYSVQPVYYGIAGTATANRTLIVDTTPPSAPTVSSNRTGSTSQNTATITYTTAEAGGTMQCSTDGTTYTTCAASPVSLTGLTDGAKTYYVRQVDAAGNVGTAGSATWTVDTAAPAAPTVSSNRTESTNQTTAQVTYTAAESGGTMQCSIDGTTYATCSPSPVSLSGLTDGVKTYSVRQVDIAGNTGSVSSVTWTVDTSAPAAPTVSSNRTGSTNQTTATITYAAAEPGGTMECSTDGATYSTCAASPVSLAGLADGEQIYSVRQVDSAGNSGASASVGWIVDTTAPGAPAVSSNRSGDTSETTAEITYSGAEPGGSVECSVNGSAFAPCDNSPFELTGLTDGPQTVSIRQQDAAGNTGPATAASWTVDTISPSVSIDSPNLPLTNNAVVAVTFTATDANLSTTECSIDGGAFAVCASPWNTPSLSDGPHTLSVRATDSAGHANTALLEITVDTETPADPAISTPAAGAQLKDPRSTVAGTAEPLTTITILVDGESAATVSADNDGNWTWTPASDLSDGPHTIAATATDSAGNTSAGDNERTVTIDTAPPDAPALTGPSAHSNNPESTVTFSGSPDTALLECSFNGEDPEPCPSSPLSFGELPDGNYTFTVTAHDAAGNSSSRTISWEVDTAAPAAPTITGGPIGQVASTSAQFEFAGAEGGGTYKCQLGSAPAVTCASPFSYTGLSDGTYVFSVRQVDAAGNVSPERTRTWTVDTTPPPAPSVTGPASPSGFTTATIEFASSESGVTYLCSLDGVTAQPCTSPLQLSGLADGTHTVEVRSYDAAGNGSAPESVTWEVDQSLFTASISGAPTGVVSSAAASLALSSTLPGSTFECSLDGAAFTACSATVNLSALSEGEHTFTVRAKNGAQTSAAVSSSWTVDLTAPSVSITSPAAGANLSSASPSVSFTAEAGASTSCKLDDDDFAACTSPLALSGLSEGSHTVTVEATDAAGNVATAAVTFTVDLTAPTATVTGGPAEGTESSDGTPTFILESDEPGGFECSVDGGAYAPCASPYAPTLGSPLEGEHTISVRAIDAAGNPSTVTTRTWIVDTQAPAAPSIDDPADNIAVQDTTPTVSGDAGSAEAGSSVDIYIDGLLSGTVTAAVDGSWSYSPATPLPDNDYAFSAKARDAAGNSSAASNTVHIRVDASSPSAEITSKPSALTNSSQATFSFSADEPASFECRLDAGPFAACTAPALLTSLADGAHTFFVRATDATDNVSASAQWSWTIDTTPPLVTVSSNDPPAGVSPTFSFASNESGTTYKCRIDGAGAFTTCSSPFSAPTLGAGDHTLEIQFTDAAGNTGTKTAPFTVASAPVTENPPTTEPEPTAPVCTGSGDEPGVPANLSVVSATAKKNTVRFVTSSDKYILIRVSIYDGNRLVGTAVRANNPGTRIVAIKTKKALTKNKNFRIRISAVTMTGGKSVADAQLATDSKGKATLLSAGGQSGGGIAGAVECGPEKGAKKVKVNVSTALKVKVSVTKLAATAKASDYAVATFKVIQGGKTVSRRVFLLKPNKKLIAPLKLLPGQKLAKGKATVQVATCSVDGVWQLFKKQVTVK